MNKFTVTYPNGIKRRINKKELDLLAPSLKRIASHEYLAVSLQTDLEQTSGPDFLAGRFTIEYPLRYGKRREVERLESVKRMVKQLSARGFSTEVAA